MSKFAIDPGHGDVHGSLGGDGGAVGYLIEQNCALNIATIVINKLKSLGHEAWNVRPSTAGSVTDSLQKRCNSGESADYFVSIHLNAGGGKGTEIFAVSDAGKKVAGNVLNEIVNLGFINRGVKDGRSLYVLRRSKPVAILIEICFVDTKSDVDLYNSIGIEKISNAIVKGLTGSEIKEQEGERNKMKNIVVYGEGADKRAAEYLADYLKCPMVSKENLSQDVLDFSEKIYIIGGNWKPNSKCILISGSDRYTTIKEVLKFIGK
ncbi:N-acetylmuramoyl-L-alanine amidase [Clostridium rectalis]|uniref:N-acetylmuramoyl-L-alanine amidase n=1 Tax=Clostridium rectalis TaxID=2040295 RepID=UPI000F63CDDB|nr:N-acetylmuramoyl-L-alanine amidase [Clostridium rectalis]